MMSKTLNAAASAALAMAATPAFAGHTPVNIPEVGAAGAVSALVVVGAVAAAFWERKRRK